MGIGRRANGVMLAAAACLLATSARDNASAKTPLPPPLPTTPEAFVQQLRALYAQPDTLLEDPNWNRWRERLYDPEFNRLILENQSYGPLVEGIVDVDFDPICACQDWPVDFGRLAMTPRPDGAMEVKQDCPPGPNACFKLDLVIKRIRGAWRAYDFLLPESLRQRLIRHNACLRKAKTTDAANDCLTP